jgi:hypothetical protein
MQLEDPISDIVPTEQARQVEPAGVDEKYPAEQFWQLDDPTPAANVPVEHCKQTVEAWKALKKPFWHCLHVLVPLIFAYFPAEQMVQFVELMFNVEYPGGHNAQNVDFDAIE